LKRALPPSQPKTPKKPKKDEEEVKGKKGKKMTKSISGQVEIIASSKVRDVSRPTVNLNKEKFLLGDRYSVQIGQVHMQSKNFSYESIIFSREPLMDAENKKKAFTFNMPVKLLIPLRDAINEIAESAN
jgi:hypothetical protein